MQGSACDVRFVAGVDSVGNMVIHGRAPDNAEGTTLPDLRMCTLSLGDPCDIL